MTVERVSVKSSTDFRTEIPDPKNEAEMMKAVQDITHWPIWRCFREGIVVTESYTMEPERDRIVFVSGSGLTITLPDAADADATEYVVRNTDAANTVTVATVAGNIDGSSTYALGTSAAVRVASDGTNYWVTGTK
jgi:hypothetical protein